MEEERQGSSKTGGTVRVNPGYPLFQIAKALLTEENHPDPATQERARQRVLRWVSVLDGLMNGTLDVGSRTPLAGVPGWATLEVVTGGFATGQLSAGGPLLTHERALLGRFPKVPDSDGRRVLNGYYLTDQGLADLQAMLRSGCYDLAVPEEGALLVAAWLARNGYAEKARDLLEELGPWFSKLRFYPAPADRPRRFGSRVFLQDVSRTLDSLRQIQPKPNLLDQREAIQVWAPLYDGVVGLFLETVEGPTPGLRLDTDGKWTRLPDGRFPVEGGWPCRLYPEDWPARAGRLLDNYEQECQRRQRRGQPVRPKDSLVELLGYLYRCTLDPKALCGRDVGRIRLLLARYVAKRGTPDSKACRALRERQARQVGAPTFQEIAQIVMPRLELHPQDSGLDDLEAIIKPISVDEAQKWSVEAGTPVPDSLQRKVRRCLVETVDLLVEQGVVTSGETLARVLPQLTSGIQSAGVVDPALRQFYAAVYRAFRQRRSLLLLNLEKQVRIEELPWVAAIDGFRRNDLPARDLAWSTLQEVAVLTVTSFPQTLIPNKLIQELRALAKTAGLDLPLVDELAADIFMGAFSEKFLLAAKVAAGLLEGTLYATYYGIDYQRVRAMPGVRSVKWSWFRKTITHPFLNLCESMAGVTYGGWNTAVNGMIIEQQQILTSQNLAVLFTGLKLRDLLGDRLEDLARQCLVWICRRSGQKAAHRHAGLIKVKNMAYAWRQMIFFLALLPRAKVETFLGWAKTRLDEQPEPFLTRFLPALEGLALAARGLSLDSQTAPPTGARRFLGWSQEEHWLSAGPDQT